MAGELKILNAIETLAEPVLAAEGLDLVEVQYLRHGEGWVLRLFIDRAPDPEGPTGESGPGSGVTLDDCVWVSREIGRILDVEEVIPASYTLEVSSPGLDRLLKKPSDFQRFAGRLVRVNINAPEGRRKIKARLLGHQDGHLRLEMDGRVMNVPFEQAERVQLEPEVKWGRA